VAGRPAARIALPRGLIVIARIVGACLAYLAVLDTVYVIAYGLAQTVVAESARGAFGLISQGVADGAALVTVLLFWRLVDRQPIRALGLRTAGAGRRLLKGAAIAALMMGFVVIVNYTLIDGATWDVNADAGQAVLVLVFGLIGFALQGPAEEVLFRGYILENVREQWGVRQAVVASSLAFGLLHAANPAFGPLPFVNLVLFGVAMALYKIYVDDNQLWGVFAIHAIWNWLQQVVFGLPNSGIVSVPHNALFTVTPNTSLPAIIWGSGFGPEGTLAATFVLLALIGACARRARHPRPKRVVARGRPATTS
jgi:membrane protease YdiL (CAAX protease family)